LSQFRFAVATTEDKKEKKSWNEAKTVVPLRCDSEITSRVKAAAQQSSNKFGSAFTLHFICIVKSKSDLKIKIVLTIKKLKKGKELWQRHQLQ
jgi:hypothetical protein